MTPARDESADDVPWGVVATSRFERDLARLPLKIAAAIVEYVTKVLPEDPPRMTKPLTGDLEGYRSARRGDYRVIVRLDEDARVVILHRVAHRAHVYRPG
ncbi:MAG TPA: type II toxin-antitoxin system RelE/ParE family toxin [Marmoricola sp.]|nr:type II toxin-antitoxin system RelE/ParE family toxin [Marmoricola sp.]